MRSLASSITTLFPLITTIPILFCVFWGGNIQVKKLKCLQYKHTKVIVIRGCATYLFGELNGVIQHQVHEGVKTAESPFNLENISASNTSLKLFHHSSPTTDYLTSSSHTCTSSKYSIPSPHGHRWSWGEPSCPWTSWALGGVPSTSWNAWQRALKQNTPHYRPWFIQLKHIDHVSQSRSAD